VICGASGQKQAAKAAESHRQGKASPHGQAAMADWIEPLAESRNWRTPFRLPCCLLPRRENSGGSVIAVSDKKSAVITVSKECS